ncbi:hypothetical protein [Thermogymnomonas acidicola]|uniref:hypothetical protein n=1 Tax=Thermogymnomonas acidicola TaxID=399579 RepID=UPI00149480EF|nr:hypothetical protein [Thermogymnomonas acidicola]
MPPLTLIGPRVQTWRVRAYLEAHGIAVPDGMDGQFQSLVSLSSLLDGPVFQRAATLFFTDTAMPDVEYRHLDDGEVHGRLGSEIARACNKFSLDPEPYLNDTYTVISVRQGRHHGNAP